MKKSYIMMILVLVISSMILVGCTNDTLPDDEPQVNEPVGEEEVVLTTEQLAEYNGENGKPAYIAVDGVIYDVSDLSYWDEWEANGLVAGTDLTDEIKNGSPSEIDKLEGAPVVGKLSD